MSGPLISHAATLTSVTYTAEPEGTGVSLLTDDGFVVFSGFPKITAIKADNVSNGSLTNFTTQLQVTYSGTLTPKNSFVMSSLYADLFDSNGKILSSSAGTNLISSGTKSSYTFSGSAATQTIALNWKSWQGANPTYIGLRLVAGTSTLPSYYGNKEIGLAKLTSFNISKLTPTITSALTENSTTIQGKGTVAGDKITCDADPSVSATVGSDLSYTLTLSGDLSGKTSVTVTESNSSGSYDDGTVTASVAQIKPLTIAATTPSLTILPDDATAFKSMSDADVIAWIVKQAGITGTDPNDNNTSSGITYAAKESNLGTTLSGLAANGSTTVDIYGTKSGAKDSATTPITIKLLPGTLTFGTVASAVDFGSLEIPTSETYYAPSTNWQVNVNDTRTVGSKWYLYASAPALTDGTHTFKGGLVYRSGSDVQNLSSGTIEVASGARQSGVTTTNVTNNWSKTNGIVIDALPGIYAGNYGTTVNWTLSDTPTN
ncbi:hypothetical protein [Lactiplantibacillus daowaiensis]|uniref:Cell surface protein n=1 Tax=Lactiplantibacillus daowaiensis TaxID=2559918 RepID=A0ABW1S2F6_9LACO|nr:hypothetical protein [Lactiplantibacillus daowaiensis]